MRTVHGGRRRAHRCGSPAWQKHAMVNKRLALPGPHLRPRDHPPLSPGWVGPPIKRDCRPDGARRGPRFCLADHNVTVVARCPGAMSRAPLLQSMGVVVLAENTYVQPDPFFQGFGRVGAAVSHARVHFFGGMRRVAARRHTRVWRRYDRLRHSGRRSLHQEGRPGGGRHHSHQGCWPRPLRGHGDARGVLGPR